MEALAGKVAWVMGAGSGIGQATAVALAAAWNGTFFGTPVLPPEGHP